LRATRGVVIYLPEAISMNTKPTLITLGVADFKKSVEFYESGLGWKKSGKSTDDMALFPFGGIALSLYPRELLAEDADVTPGGSGFAGITISINVESEKEADKLMAAAEKAGAKIIKPAQKVFWGGYSGYFADPDGHLWEVAYNPFWQLNADGSLEL
jgi:predicted lactoylglutathione lyase